MTTVYITNVLRWYWRAYEINVKVLEITNPIPLLGAIIRLIT